MITLKKLIYSIKNLQGRGEHTDDFKFSDRQFEFIIDHYRAELAAQRINARKSVDGFYQTLNDLKLEKSKQLRPYKDDVTLLVSKEKLPQVLTSHESGSVFGFVGDRAEFMGFQKSELSTYNIDLQHPYIKNTFFELDDHLYIGTRDINYRREVFVQAVFTSPRDVREFEKGDIDPFDPFNWEYPIPGNLIGQLTNMIMSNEYKWTHLFLTDYVNDGRDDKQMIGSPGNQRQGDGSQ